MRTTARRSFIQKLAGVAIVLCTVVIALLFLALRQDLSSVSAHLTVTNTDCHFCPAFGDDPDYGGFGTETSLSALVYCKTSSGQQIPIPGATVNFTYQRYHLFWDYTNKKTLGSTDFATASKTTDARGVATARPPTTIDIYQNKRSPSNGKVTGGDIPYPNVRTVVANVPGKITVNNQDYTVQASGPVANPDCSTGQLDPLVAGPFGNGNSSTAPTNTQAYNKARPACRYFPNGIDGNPATDDRKFVCMDQASYGLWYALCSNPGGQTGSNLDCGPNYQIWMNMARDALSCGGSTIYSGWSPRTYISTYQNFFVAKSSWGNLPSLNKSDQIRAQWYRGLARLYGGVVDAPIVAYSSAGTVFTWGGTEPVDAENQNIKLPLPHYAAPFTNASNFPHYDWTGNGSIPHDASTLRSDTVVDDFAESAPFATYVAADTLVPKFEYTCTPASQVTSSNVQIYDSESSPCPSGAICNDTVQTDNKLVSSNTPIYVGTYDNTDNYRSCSGQLNENGDCINGTWIYRGRDMNPFEIQLDVVNLGDTDVNGNSLPQPYKDLRDTNVVFQTAGANSPTDPNNVKFTIGFNGSAVTNGSGVQCLAPNANPTTVANMQNCLSNPNCSACAELKKQAGQDFTVLPASTGSPGTTSRQRSVRFRYQVAFRNPSGNWQAGNKNIFIAPHTSAAQSYADSSNNGWQLINNNGAICTWNGSWDCGPGIGTLAYDVTAPGGTLTVSEDQTLNSDQLRYTVAMADADTQGYFGRFTRKCKNNVTSPCNASFMNYNGTQLKGNDYSPVRGSAGSQWSSVSGSNYGLVVSGAAGNDKVQAGIWLYDKASNSRWIRASDVTVQAPWLKTSLGDVYSYGGNTGFNLQISSAYAAEDQEIENKFINGSFRPQRSTLSGFWIGTNASDFGVTGGYQNNIEGYNGNYNRSQFMQTNYDDYNNTALFSLDPQRFANSGVFGWYENIYETLLDATTQNCQTLGAGTCAPITMNGGGDLRTNLQSATTPYKFIKLDGGTYNISAGTRCTGVNTIFLTNSAKLTIDNDLLASNNISGCLFVLDGNTATKVTIGDSAVANGSVYGLTTTGSFTDVVEAGFILERAAQFETARGAVGSDGRFDRLILRGFIFAATNESISLQRDLALKDNRNYPAEWIIYDTRSIDLYRTLAGDNRAVTITCTGDLQHPECR